MNPRCSALGGESCRLARAQYGDCKPKGILFEPIVRKPSIFERFVEWINSDV